MDIEPERLHVKYPRMFYQYTREFSYNELSKCIKRKLW